MLSNGSAGGSRPRRTARGWTAPAIAAGARAAVLSYLDAELYGLSLGVPVGRSQFSRRPVRSRPDPRFRLTRANANHGSGRLDVGPWPRRQHRAITTAPIGPTLRIARYQSTLPA